MRFGGATPQGYKDLDNAAWEVVPIYRVESLAIVVLGVLFIVSINIE